MIIMKFGGASLSTAEGILKACKLIREYSVGERMVLVVSAMKGVTDELYLVVDEVKNKKTDEALRRLAKIKEKHIRTLREIDKRAQVAKVECDIINLMSRLENFVKNVVVKEMTTARSDFIVSFGEKLSCLLVADAMESVKISSHPIDASFIIVTTHRFGNAVPLYKTSQGHIEKILYPLIKNGIVPVVTGFIGSTPDGCTTTLGRGGSDLSAAYLANLLNASKVILWKDVNGIYTNDPHLDAKATLLSKISYYKARNMAKNGAKIIYYKAIDPVQKKHIPIYVKSFLDPEGIGTVVTN